MLEVPFANEDRAFDGLGLAKDEVPVYGFAWHPKLVLLPTWRLDTRSRILKRSIDLAIALTSLILLAVPAALLMLAIRFESRGPALYRQQRIGLNGREFTTLKFRTMRWRPEENSAPLQQAIRDDPRVTRLGYWLRRFSIDELPQLVNILRGEMSVVGPRPHAPGTKAGGHLFEDITQSYEVRHLVKPGLTGLAQIRGWRGETDTEDKLLHRIDCDFEYIACWSVRLDLAIIWRTGRSMLRMSNAF